MVEATSGDVLAMIEKLEAPSERKVEVDIRDDCPFAGEYTQKGDVEEA